MYQPEECRQYASPRAACHALRLVWCRAVADCSLQRLSGPATWPAPEPVPAFCPGTGADRVPRILLRRLPRRVRKALSDDACNVLGDRIAGTPGPLVIATALECGLSAYDAEFVVLARMLGVPLATLDKAILESAGDVAVPLVLSDSSWQARGSGFIRSCSRRRFPRDTGGAHGCQARESPKVHQGRRGICRRYGQRSGHRRENSERSGPGCAAPRRGRQPRDGLRRALAFRADGAHADDDDWPYRSARQPGRPRRADAAVGADRHRHAVGAALCLLARQQSPGHRPPRAPSHGLRHGGPAAGVLPGRADAAAVRLPDALHRVHRERPAARRRRRSTRCTG